LARQIYGWDVGVHTVLFATVAIGAIGLGAAPAPLDAFIDRFVAEPAGRQN
jgi:hypothetical protein